MAGPGGCTRLPFTFSLTALHMLPREPSPVPSFRAPRPHWNHCWAAIDWLPFGGRGTEEEEAFQGTASSLCHTSQIHFRNKRK